MEQKYLKTVFIGASIGVFFLLSTYIVIALNNAPFLIFFLSVPSFLLMITGSNSNISIVVITIPYFILLTFIWNQIKVKRKAILYCFFIGIFLSHFFVTIWFVNFSYDMKVGIHNLIEKVTENNSP